MAKNKLIFLSIFHFYPFFSMGCPWKGVSDLGNWDGDGYGYVLSFPANQSDEDCSAAARSVSGPVTSCVFIGVWPCLCPCHCTFKFYLLQYDFIKWSHKIMMLGGESMRIVPIKDIFSLGLK